jgi:hypothetical protein
MTEMQIQITLGVIIGVGVSLLVQFIYEAISEKWWRK